MKRNLYAALALTAAGVLASGPAYAEFMFGDADALVQHGISPGEIEQAIRTQNVELPGGRIGDGAREEGVRVVSRIVDQPDPIRVRLAPGRYTVEFKSSREDPEPYSLPATMMSGTPASLYFIAAS